MKLVDKQKVSRGLLGALLLLGMAGCSDGGGRSDLDKEIDRLYNETFGDDKQKPVETGGAVAANWTKVLEEDVLQHLLEIEPNRLTFSLGHPLLEKIQLMEILVSSSPDDPFLRRVVDIQKNDSTISFHTVDASLSEVMLGGDVSFGASAGGNGNGRTGSEP